MNIKSTVPDGQINLADLEEKVLKLWQEERLFERVTKAREGGQPFVFFEGPPTANAAPGLHHVEARVFKDLILRYQTMRGKKIDRKSGWDTHGLPVELQVEKKLGLKNKKEIEQYGIAQFNAECRADVWRFKEEWEKLTKRIGFWLDMEHPYITYENEYIESVWAILKRVSELKDPEQRPMLYLGHKVVPFCTRCGTVLSSHEVAQGYRAVTENSVYVKFKVKSAETPTFILAWTTTLWTLPGNVALAVGAGINYVTVLNRQTRERYILAAAKVNELFGQDTLVIKKQKGSELAGLQYEPLFPGVINDNGQAFRVYAAPFVTTEGGTGIVHTAVMYGEDDYQLGEELGLPKAHTVAEDGRFLPHLTEGLADRYVKDPTTDQQIVSSLERRHLLFKQTPYTHDYPFCWRCDTPLLYYARASWFIRMSVLRQELVQRNRDVHWEPDYIKAGRMGEWLEGAKDWAISRERYWGTPLPFWLCTRGHLTVVGSASELQHLQHPDSKLMPDDLHRPYIDQVLINCPKCQKEAKRVLEVADVWLDSGAMPLAQWGYPHQSSSDQKLAHHFPADYICEAIDQTRGWFYTLLAVSALLGREAPYRNVICLGHLLDEHGKKMSKSKGNVVDPWKLMAKYGVDAVRFYFFSINPAGEPILFSEKDVQITQRKVLMLWWNVHKFFMTYAKINNLTFDNRRLQTESFDLRSRPPDLEAARNRGFKPTERLDIRHSDLANVLDRWVVARLNQVIVVVTQSLDRYDVLTASRELAGFIDVLSTWYVRRSRGRFNQANHLADREAAYSTLHFVLTTLARLMAPFAPFMSDFIHRELVEESVHLADWPESGHIDQEILSKMIDVREIVSAGLEQRMVAGIKVRQVLRSATLGKAGIPESDLLNLIRDELNVLQVKIDAHQTEAVVLDTHITPDLEMKGIHRELTRAVQDQRKRIGLTVADRVKVAWSSSDELVRQMMADQSLLQELEASTRSTVSEASDLSGAGLAIDLNGHSVQIDLARD